MLIASLNPEAIKRRFLPSAYQGGWSYYRQERVSQMKQVQLQAECEAYTTTVRGTQPYQVHIEISLLKKGLVIRGVCACFIGGNCKHVVASLLALHFRGEKQAAVDPPLPTVVDKQDPNVEAWLQALKKSIGIDNRAPAGIDTRYGLVYLLGQRNPPIGCTVQLLLARRFPSGKLRTTKNYSTTAASHQQHLYPIDKTLWVKLAVEKRWAPFSNHEDHFYLYGEQGEQLLLELIETGRCYLSTDLSPLKKGPVKIATLEWQMDDDGGQTLHIMDAGDACFGMDHLWYVDKKKSTVGLLETGLDKRVNALLLSAPRIPAEQTKNVVSVLKAHPALVLLQPPKVFSAITTQPLHPVPCLHLFEAPLNPPFDPRKTVLTEARATALAHLRFRYQETEVDWQDKHPSIAHVQNDTLVRFIRNKKKENEALALLARLRLPAIEQTSLWENNKPLGPYFLIPFAYPHPLDFSATIVPKLRAKGWQVTMATDYPYQILEEPLEDWYSSIEESSVYDWFDLELGIIVQGEKINLLPVLQQLLQSPSPPWENSTAESVLLPLPDGRYLALPTERIQTIVGVLLELYDTESLTAGSLRLSACHAARLLALQAAMGAAQLRWFGGDRLRKFAQKLTGFQGIENVMPPEGFQGTLRPYQQQGLNWLQFLREYGLSGILADDMGLGKTVQALAHLLLEKTRGRMTLPSLVIAPTSLMWNWQMEAQRFAPDLKTVVLHGSDRKSQFDTIAQSDLVLTTYPLLLRDKETLFTHNFYFLMLDEAQCIKNSKSLTTHIVQQLHATHRLCLTGTPLENHLGELWSLFHFMMPGLLGNERQFNTLFRTPIEKQANQARRACLQQRIAPFLLRRTKDNVLKELPEKVLMIRQVELEGAQRDLYETIRSTLQKKVQQDIAKLGLARSHIMILDALLKLRQVCCDPRLLRMESAQKTAAKSAKLNLLMALLPELLQEGRRILLFSQFTTMLTLIEEELITARIPYVLLTGKTVDRATPTQSFQHHAVPLFLISLKAGGTGLNLTAADTVIHYDPWWNPAVENQATDRAHRIGQDKTVFVYKLVTKDTVEEKILWMQQNKQALMEGLFSDSPTEHLTWTAHDLQALFEPLHAKTRDKPLPHKTPAIRVVSDKGVSSH